MPDWPTHWNFDEDGLELEGSYVNTTTAPSAYGDVAVVNIRVNGEDRALWLRTLVLREKFADELRRRGAQDFEPGERIVVTRAAQKKTAASGQPYWPFVVAFPDAQKPTAASLLGVEPDGGDTHDGIPF